MRPWRDRPHGGRSQSRGAGTASVGAHDMNTAITEATQGLFRLLAADIRAKAVWLYGSLSRVNLLKAMCTDGTFSMILYRLMQASRRRGLVPLTMLFNKLNVVFGHCIIGRNADFGPGFVLIHSFGVVINSAVRGGRDIKIEHLVTIGADKGLSPVLGNNVFVGVAARIIGGVKVGDNVRIGANAVVVSDIPDGVTAVGIPAKPIGRGETESPGDGEYI